MCVSLANDSSETVVVIIVTVSDHGHASVRVNYIDLDLQGHTNRNHEYTLTISETLQAMPIKFAVKIVRLKVYLIFLSPMTLPVIQGHSCVSNVTHV